MKVLTGQGWLMKVNYELVNRVTKEVNDGCHTQGLMGT